MLLVRLYSPCFFPFGFSCILHWVDGFTRLQAQDFTFLKSSRYDFLQAQQGLQTVCVLLGFRLFTFFEHVFYLCGTLENRHLQRRNRFPLRGHFGEEEGAQCSGGLDHSSQGKGKGEQALNHLAIGLKKSCFLGFVVVDSN